MLTPAAAVFALLVGGVVMDDPPAGWETAIPPRAIGSLPFTCVAGEVGLTLVQLADQSWFASVSHPASAVGTRLVHTRYAVALLGHRRASAHAAHQAGMQRDGHVGLTTFAGGKVEPPPVQVTVEVLPPARQIEKARMARVWARIDGLEVLALPEVGEQLTLDLTDVRGEPVHSRDLRGKVVLLHVW